MILPVERSADVLRRSMSSSVQSSKVSGQAMANEQQDARFVSASLTSSGVVKLSSCFSSSRC